MPPAGQDSHQRWTAWGFLKGILLAKIGHKMLEEVNLWSTSAWLSFMQDCLTLLLDSLYVYIFSIGNHA